MIYLVKEELLFINKTWISLFGGIYYEASENINNRNSLDFLIDSPKQEIFETQLYKTIFEKAANYPFFIIKDHIFADGNKRTGMVAAFLFLEKNGFKVAEEVKSKRVVNYAERIASCKPNITNVSRWLRNISILRS